MLKSKLTALVGAAGIILATLTTPLLAGEYISIGGGVSGGATVVSVTGEEKMLQSGDLNKATETGEAPLGSAYYELSFFDGWFEDRWGTSGFTIGYEHIWGEAKIKKLRENIMDVYGTGNTAVNVGNNYMEASFENLRTMYIETPGITPLGFYLRYGTSEMDIKTHEEMATGASYGDTSTDAETYGFGFKKAGGGFLIKTEFNYTDWDSVTLSSTHSGPGSTGGADQVSATPENVSAKFTVGYRF